MKKILISLTILTILGAFYLDNIKNSPWLLKKLQPDYFYTIESLDILEKYGQGTKIFPEHQSFKYLLKIWSEKYWPENLKIADVKWIGTSGGYDIVGKRTDFDLILNIADNEIGRGWPASLVRAEVNDKFDKNIFLFKKILIILAILLYLVEHIIKNKNNHPRLQHPTT